MIYKKGDPILLMAIKILNKARDDANGINNPFYLEVKTDDIPKECFRFVNDMTIAFDAFDYGETFDFSGNKIKTLNDCLEYIELSEDNVNVLDYHNSKGDIDYQKWYQSVHKNGLCIMRERKALEDSIKMDCDKALEKALAIKRTGGRL